MDFLNDAAEGTEDLAATFLTDGETAAKPEDIDFDDFFADIKD